MITQCRRCQGWGHATGNCFHAPKCLKCGEGHFTRDCTLPRETPPTCANCKGQHLANDRKCPVYTYRLEKITQGDRQFEREAAEYIPAPIPSTNAWAERSRRAASAPGPFSRSHDASQETQPASRRPSAPLQETEESTQRTYDQFSRILTESIKLTSKIDLLELWFLTGGPRTTGGPWRHSKWSAKTS